MPAWRDRVAHLRLIVAVERGGQAAQGRQGRQVVHCLGAADPTAQVFDVQAHEVCVLFLWMDCRQIVGAQGLSVKY